MLQKTHKNIGTRNSADAEVAQHVTHTIEEVIKLMLRQDLMDQSMNEIRNAIV